MRGKHIENIRFLKNMINVTPLLDKKKSKTSICLGSYPGYPAHNRMFDIPATERVNI